MLTEFIRFVVHPLHVLIFLPLVGAGFIAFIKHEKRIRQVAIGTTVATFLASLWVWKVFVSAPADNYGFRLNYGVPWFKELGVAWYTGIDGISLALILLTTVVSISAAISSRSIDSKLRMYYILFLLLITSLLGVLVARDYFLFFVFWELMLLPMYFLIGIWGGKRRIYASIKFFLYTLVGSVLLLIAILALHWSAPEIGFGISQLAEKGATLPIKGAGLATQTTLFLLFFFGFGVKVPIVPFHTWLPDAHVQAPTPISMMLAAVLLKMGTYGFVRILLPTVPGAFHDLSGIAVPLVATVGVVSMLYGALVAMAQKDWKSMVAYSSISHMGYLVFALATNTELGLSAAMFIMISHGLISACMFHLVGVIYERTHNRNLLAYGGLGALLPGYFTIWIFVGMANLGLPGLSGFWGEFMTFVAAFSNHHWMVTSGLFAGMNFFRVLSAFGVITIVVTAAYMILMIQRIFMGPLNEKWADLKDMTKTEKWTIIPLMALILLFGIWPQGLVSLYAETTRALATNLGFLIAGS
ncbi:NADH-quinone oxidoreductase subunit M [bacterium]|nr:NADH-quinone oxidoreductase subunit M [bacterium]